MKRKISTTWLTAIASVFVLVLPSMTRVAAENETVIRIATFTPRGSSGERVFRAWGNSLSEKTGGSVKLHFVTGAAAGDEREVIRKLKAGELDAASLTSMGVGQVARPVTILQIPGLVTGYDQLTSVRSQLASDFERIFAEEGLRLLGWNDSGFGRVLSKKPLAMPQDYNGVRAWVPRDDPAFPEYLKLLGANGVPLGVPEVFAAVQKGTVDTLMSSALAAVALQWFRDLSHVSKEAEVPILGATLVRRQVYDALSPEHQRALTETAESAHRVLVKQVQKEDEQAYATLTGKLGLKEFSTRATPEQRKAWAEVHEKLQKNLTGKLWTKELYQKVTQAVAKAKE
jgi:TRAP-type C4-dicarboxylate transport system substrate-binding protein